MSDVRCSPEQEQRVLACLFLNDGMVESKEGWAMSRLFNLTANPNNHSLSTFRGQVSALEKRGVVMRDNRFASNGTDKARVGSPVGDRAGMRCYGIYMVEADKRPEEWAIQELKDLINARMMGKVAHAKKEDKKRRGKDKVELLKTAEKAKAPTPEQLVLAVAPTGDPTTDLANSLLARVVDILSNPPVQAQEVDEAAITKPLEETIELQKQRIELLESNLDKLKAACDNGERMIENQKREIAELKRTRRPEHLTQKLQDLLTPEQWEALQREPPKP